MLVVSATLQGSLLAMAVYFEFLCPNAKRKGGSFDDGPGQDVPANGNAVPERSSTQVQASVGEDQPSEETPLLQSQ